jgi:hypothetical protein
VVPRIRLVSATRPYRRIIDDHRKAARPLRRCLGGARAGGFSLPSYTITGDPTELCSRGAPSAVVVRDALPLRASSPGPAKLPRRLINPKNDHSRLPSVDFSLSPGAHVVHTPTSKQLKNLISRSNPSWAPQKRDSLAIPVIYLTLSMR